MSTTNYDDHRLKSHPKPANFTLTNSLHSQIGVWSVRKALLWSSVRMEHIEKRYHIASSERMPSLAIRYCPFCCRYKPQYLQKTAPISPPQRGRTPPRIPIGICPIYCNSQSCTKGSFFFLDAQKHRWEQNGSTAVLLAVAFPLLSCLTFLRSTNLCGL